MLELRALTVETDISIISDILASMRGWVKCVNEARTSNCVVGRMLRLFELLIAGRSMTCVFYWGSGKRFGIFSGEIWRFFSMNTRQHLDEKLQVNRRRRRCAIDFMRDERRMWWKAQNHFSGSPVVEHLQWNYDRDMLSSESFSSLSSTSSSWRTRKKKHTVCI